MSAAAILAVEDDPANRELIVELLEADGYQVYQAKDGYAAIEMAQVERPRLILMDLGLPGLDGIETTRRLKADPVLRSIPIVVVTAHALAGVPWSGPPGATASSPNRSTARCYSTRSPA